MRKKRDGSAGAPPERAGGPAEAGALEESAEREVQEWSHRLRLWMTDRSRSQRSVERQLGWGTGYLSQLLRPDPPHLKIKHLLAVLHAIGVPPAVFFADLYGLRPAESGDELTQMSRTELQGFVARTLREELARMIESEAKPSAAGGHAAAGHPENPRPDAKRA